MTPPSRCLVLGGRGFIGSHLVSALLEQGRKVRCFDRPRVLPVGESHFFDRDFELFEGDLLSEADVAEALEGCDVCFHLISTTLPKSSNADPVFDIESNVLGTVRLLSHAVKVGLKKVIFVSSGGTVYGVPRMIPLHEDHPTDPICSYGITKLAIEKYLSLFHKLHGLEYAILRLANPFGEGQRIHASQGAIAVFLGKALRDETIDIWGDGSIVRDYIHIDDVVSALLLALNSNCAERVFNIGSGKGRSLNEVLNAIETVIGKKTFRHYLPGRPFDVPASLLCIERARMELAWTPKVRFEEGISRFAKWIELDEEVCRA